MFGLVRLTEEEKRVLLKHYSKKERSITSQVARERERVGPDIIIMYSDNSAHRLHELGIPFKYSKDNGIEPVDKI